MNLATSSPSHQSIHVQGVKRIAQGIPGGGIITKKVIIATINGTQRILTPVSSPQMIAVKSNLRLLADGSLSGVGGVLQGQGTALTIIQQKPVLATARPQVKQVTGLTSPNTIKSVDNKTCRWKFENGQICGKVITIHIWTIMIHKNPETCL